MDMFVGVKLEHTGREAPRNKRTATSWMIDTVHMSESKRRLKVQVVLTHNPQVTGGSSTRRIPSKTVATVRERPLILGHKYHRSIAVSVADKGEKRAPYINLTTDAKSMRFRGAE